MEDDCQICWVNAKKAYGEKDKILMNFKELPNPDNGSRVCRFDI